MKKQLHTNTILTAFFLFLCFFALNIMSNRNITIQAAETVTPTSSVVTTEQISEFPTSKGDITPSVTLKKTSYTLYPGQKVTTKLQFFKDFKGNVTYTSDNDKVATFQDGMITALKKGKTTLTVKTDDNTVIHIKVKVKKAIKNIDIHLSKMSLNKKDKRTISVNIDRNGSTEPVTWSSSNRKIVSVNKNGKITGKKNGTATIYCKSKYSGIQDKIKITVKNTKYIAFTFDDGPGPSTNDLLDTLKKYNSKATFFLVGNRVNSFAKELQREYSDGHQIGNHSYNHANLPKLSYLDINQQFQSTNSLIQKYTGQKTTVVRPPYGAYNDNVIKAAKLPIVMWSVDTLDWKYRDSNYVKKTILSNAADGEIVLLHDIHKTSVDGFKKAIKSLKKKGYELVTVQELYEVKGKQFAKGNKYFSCK